jgi:hypothetical protein
MRKNFFSLSKSAKRFQLAFLGQKQLNADFLPTPEIVVYLENISIGAGWPAGAARSEVSGLCADTETRAMGGELANPFMRLAGIAIY